MTETAGMRGPLVPHGTGAPPAPAESGNLADILERVLDRGVVIAGDIRVSLLDIELLTIKLRLVVASVDTAKQMGIDWWEQDPWLTTRRQRVDHAAEGGERAVEGGGERAVEGGGERAVARGRRDRSRSLEGGSR